MALDKNRDIQLIRELNMAVEEIHIMFQFPIATGYGTIHTGNQRGHCSFLRQQNVPIFYSNRKNNNDMVAEILISKHSNHEINDVQIVTLLQLALKLK